MSYDDLINNIKTDISKIKNNDYSQSIWNEVSDNFKNMSEEIANKLITRKNDLGNINGLNLVVLMHTQEFSEQFYDQEYIKELLDTDCIEYCKIMDCTIPLREEFWSTLFYTHQWFFSNDYIRKILNILLIMIMPIKDIKMFQLMFMKNIYLMKGLNILIFMIKIYH